ncbi:MAG: hypothetical protein GY899_13050 [Verrucomicrobiaceae bacterium]|nr:hypothetical protein [Verrucomicrobiaceae bacterium]
MNPGERQPAKSNYSHKEMLDKLRDGEEKSSGRQSINVELIEDQEGQQIIKEVRKRRKRRTRQPKKIRERRIKLLKRTALIGSISLVLLFAGLYTLMIFGIRGQRFRSSVGERVSELVGVGVGFGSFRLSGLDLDNGKAVIEDIPGSLFHGAELTYLKSRVNLWTLFSRDWHIGSVHASKGSFRFGVPVLETEPAGIGGREPKGRRLMTLAGLGLDDAPGMINCSGIRIADCDLYWEEEGLDNEPFLGASVANISELMDGAFRLRFKGGNLKVPGWPSLKIGKLEGSVKNGKYKIRESILVQGEKGSVAMSGFVNTGAKGEFRLVVPFSDLPLSDNVHAFWKDKLRGNIDGEMEVTGSLAKKGEWLAEGSFSSNNLVLSNHVILQRLAIGLGEALLARIDFHSVEGRLRRTAGALELYELRAANPSLFRLRGGITIHTDGRLEGLLDVGVPGAFPQRVGIMKPSIFTEDAQGFVWAKVKLGGTIDAPEEDLTKRLEKIRAGILKENLKLVP